MPSRVALIVNGKSRRGAEWFDEAKTALSDEGVELSSATLVKNPKQITSYVEAAIRNGSELVCVGGGDGTFSGVVGSFVGKEAILGVLPLGTGNSLARDLGIPSNVGEACKIAIHGTPSSIDLGLVNGQHFVNVATVGLTTLIAESLDDGAKKKFGRAVYLVAAFHALVKGRRFYARLELPDGVREFKSMQIVVGNGRFHAGPFPVTPDAEISSGLLAGYSVNTSRKSVLLRYVLKLRGGHHVDMDEIEPFEAKSFSLETRPFKRITVDGEIKLKTPAKFEVQAGAIQVMSPKPLSPEPEAAK